MDAILTTGQVARRLGVSPKTARRLLDRGFLQGFRQPGSGHRRVTEQKLEAFMALHMPEMFKPPALHLQSTGAFAGYAGVKCRVWAGRTGSGLQVRVYVPYVEAVHASEQGAVDRELQGAAAGEVA